MPSSSISLRNAKGSHVAGESSTPTQICLRVLGTPAAAQMADALQHAVEDWIAALYTACGAGSANAPKTETLDNTKHTAGCTTTALPGVAVAMVLLFLLKRTLCGESKLRKLYSGSEDAPEVCAAPSFSRITPFFAAQLRPLLFSVLLLYASHSLLSSSLFLFRL